jgi:hypothetical protein
MEMGNKSFLFVIILILQISVVKAQSVSDSSEFITDDMELDDQGGDVNEVSNTTYTKRNFQDGFKEKYTGDDYRYTEKPQKTGWFSRFIDWLSQTKPNHASGRSAIILVWIMKALVVLVVIYGVFVVVSILLGKEGAWFLLKKSDESTLSYRLNEDELKSSDYTSLFKEARLNQDYRLAVRYRYLMLLQQLSSQGFIKYHPEKTNTDYSREIVNQELSDLFTYLSYIYDHTWYGAFTISEFEFSNTLHTFDRTNKMM